MSFLRNQAYFPAVTVTRWFRVTFLLIALMSVDSRAANAQSNSQNRTMGGYIYSWFEWAVALPKSMILGLDAEVVEARAALISDIRQLKETVGRTGFAVESISVGMGLIPTVTLSLSFDKAISDQDREVLNAELQRGKYNILERALIDALLEASSVKIGGANDNLTLTGADVDIDIIPSVTLTFEEETKP